MEYPSKIIGELVEKFVKLPGIGKRTAIRMVLNLLKQDEEDVYDLGKLLSKLKTDINYCEICYNISDSSICNICSSNNRDKSSICIVEDLRDVISIENTGQYTGTYHVLGGLISPIDGVSPDNLNISSLFSRIDNKDIKEIIFALSATMEGDTTMFYIAKNFKKGTDIKISAIARGISIGGVLEFADEITLGRSILDRTPYST